MTLLDKIISASIWNYSGTALRIFAQVLVQIILARLVGPKAFGIVALAVLPAGFFCMLTERGLGSALVQRKDLTENDLQSVWTLTSLAGLILMSFLMIVATPVSIALGDTSVAPVLRALSPMVLLHGLAVVPLSVLRRDLNLKYVQIAQQGAYLFGFMGVGIFCAVAGAGIWALVFAWLSFYGAAFLLALRFSKFKIAFTSPLFVEPSLRSFGHKILLTNLSGWVVENLDNLAIGKFFGAQSLGFYSVSYNLVRTPANHLVVSLQTVLFPASARAQDNTTNLRKGYMAVVSIVALIALPVFLSIAAVSETFILALFGAPWRDASSVIAPLAAAMVFHTVMAVTGPVLSGKGCPEIEQRVQAWTALLLALVLIVTVQTSVAVVAWGVFSVYVFRMFCMTKAALHELQIDRLRILKVFRGPVCLAFVVVCAIAFSDKVLLTSVPPLWRLTLDILVAGSIMLGALWLKPIFYIDEELRNGIANLVERHPSLKFLLTRFSARDI